MVSANACVDGRCHVINRKTYDYDFMSSIEKAATVAANVWAGYIKHPAISALGSEDLEKSFNSQALFFPQVGDEKIERFRVKLKEEICAYFSETTENKPQICSTNHTQELLLITDYEPEEDSILTKCCTHADIDTKYLPKKSCMWITPLQIEYKIGYGSQWQRWLF